MGYLLVVFNITALSILLWSWFAPAPFLWILVWVISLNIYAYIRISPSPKVLKVLGDLKTAALFSAKSFLCVTIFFIIRGYLTQLIDMTPFQVWTAFTQSGGTKPFLNYPLGKVMYETVFILGVGWLVTEAIFKKSRKYIIGIFGFLAIAFVAQTIVYSSDVGSQTARAVLAPFSDENAADKIATGGAVGGPYQLTKEVLFGPVKPQPTPPPREISWVVQKVSSTPAEVCRVYNGDFFYYRSPRGFTTHELVNGEWKKFVHNPSMFEGEVRKFYFSNLPQEGCVFSISSDSEFWLEFRIARG